MSRLASAARGRLVTTRVGAIALPRSRAAEVEDAARLGALDELLQRPFDGARVRLLAAQASCLRQQALTKRESRTLHVDRLPTRHRPGKRGVVRCVGEGRSCPIQLPGPVVLQICHLCVIARPMSETLTVRLDESLAKALADEAERTSRPKGRIVSEALEAHFRRTRPSALQALQQYVGSITGPSDLSTNRKYLSTLGGRRRA